MTYSATLPDGLESIYLQHRRLPIEARRRMAARGERSLRLAHGCCVAGSCGGKGSAFATLSSHAL